MRKSLLSLTRITNVFLIVLLLMDGFTEGASALLAKRIRTTGGRLAFAPACTQSARIVYANRSVRNVSSARTNAMWEDDAPSQQAMHAIDMQSTWFPDISAAARVTGGTKPATGVIRRIIAVDAGQTIDKRLSNQLHSLSSNKNSLVYEPSISSPSLTLFENRSRPIPKKLPAARTARKRYESKPGCSSLFSRAFSSSGPPSVIQKHSMQCISSVCFFPKEMLVKMSREGDHRAHGIMVLRADSGSGEIAPHTIISGQDSHVTHQGFVGDWIIVGSSGTMQLLLEKGPAAIIQEVLERRQLEDSGETLMVAVARYLVEEARGNGDEVATVIQLSPCLLPAY